MIQLPTPRGSLSEKVFASLRDGTPHTSLGAGAESADDAALTLWTLYELHYRGFDGVDDSLEWHPELIRLRGELEAELEATLRGRWSGPPAYDSAETPFEEAFFAAVEEYDGPSLAQYVQSDASAEEVLELLRFRSLYHLKESDPSTWAIPRLPVAAKAGLAELQYDEYGNGRPDRLHAALFAEAMAALGLDPTPGAYVDEAPLEVLEQNNAMSLFGLHRRLRGAAVGHLAAFEATSSQPSRRMAQGLARLELAPEMVDYYREHVEADAVHEQLAVRMICRPLVAAEPETEPDLWLGAFTCLDLESRVAAHLLDRWGAR